MLITCENITKSYTDKILLDNQTITVGANDKIGIIGVNGCGKSTLMKIIAGIISIILLSVFSLIYYNPPIAIQQSDFITNFKF